MKRVFLAVLAVLALSGSVQAGFIVGTVGAVPIGQTQYDGTTVSQSTTITLTDPLFVNVAGIGDLAPITFATPVSLSDINITAAGGNVFDFGSTGFEFILFGGSFTSMANNPNTIAFQGDGLFLGNGFDPTAGTFSLSVTRTELAGGNATTNSSVTFAANGSQVQPVAEPAAAVLAGVGVIGLFGVRMLRRKVGLS